MLTVRRLNVKGLFLLRGAFADKSSMLLLRGLSWQPDMHQLSPDWCMNTRAERERFHLDRRRCAQGRPY
ncbi:hypothetical protein EHS86_10005 [Erwinia amylovora]|uniref:Uncharacterized protein n=2 Tax=Erwinia amylovora TaxID=552 RepID=A0A831A2E6_ERWAM|nr:hypothetical protein AD997_10750 [Erwinia amylovora]EKV54892.1 hypothetical protein EaACW_2198 [Erwinia amylovora ACW56400]CBA21227.1 hypothetical protein predicted by Glimmer/Critica [Erwinia amylovora CFBP1430]CCO79043.1 hypothetical protein BN432_2252 [Erwinia amylovora Ea356]CCO82847.1 hypothetical protein BN433_2283 [Erwinia amylovora Ea266]CCO90409.1 hypothetical protein BN435_2245 [Erwinia amylovora 01SFR-BO]CCO94177.1 hypothetical protein BN437_2254 [Erwinia amylovora NBRC 12687 = 